MQATFPPRCVSDLKLDSQVETIQSDAVVFSPQPDGTQLTIWRDTAKTVQEIARFSEKDAAEYPKFLDLMTALAGVMWVALMEMTPPDLPEVNFKDIRGGVGMLGPLRKLGRKRIPESASHPADVGRPICSTSIFESPVVKGAIGASCVLGISYGPMESGLRADVTHATGRKAVQACFGPRASSRVGSVHLTGAMADAARDFGAEIRTGATVTNITMWKAGKATGVRGRWMASRSNAPIVVSATDVKLDLPQARRADSASTPRSFATLTASGTAAPGTRIHLALSGLPEFSSL